MDNKIVKKLIFSVFEKRKSGANNASKITHNFILKTNELDYIRKNISSDFSWTDDILEREYNFSFYYSDGLINEYKIKSENGIAYKFIFNGQDWYENLSNGEFSIYIQEKEKEKEKDSFFKIFTDKIKECESEKIKEDLIKNKSDKILLLVEDKINRNNFSIFYNEQTNNIEGLIVSLPSISDDTIYGYVLCGVEMSFDKILKIIRFYDDVINGKWIKFSDACPEDFNLDWVLVQFVEKSGFVGLPHIAEFDKSKNIWRLQGQESDNTSETYYINNDCIPSSWKIIENSPEKNSK